MNFLLDVNKSPKRLKKDVYKRRGESEPSFFDHFGKLNFVKRVGAYWSSESESSGEWRWKKSGIPTNIMEFSDCW